MLVYGVARLRPLGSVQLASWGSQRSTRCLALHKYISNEMMVGEDPNILPSNHVGWRANCLRHLSGYGKLFIACTDLSSLGGSNAGTHSFIQQI